MDVALDDSFWGFSTPNIAIKSSTTNLESYSPIRQAKGFSSDCNAPNITSISALFVGCRPFAVFWVVSKRIVLAFKGVILRWSRPYISEEIHEVLSPSVANKNTSTTVVHKRFVFWIMTPLDHAAPYSVFRSGRHPMGSLSISNLLPLEATATYSISYAQIWSSNSLKRATITPALPHSVMEFISSGETRSSSKYKQTTESLSDKINKLGHSVPLNTQGKNVTLMV